MSVKIMAQVWTIEDKRVTGSRRLVLLALADNASDEGVCWPSYNTIAKKCAISRTYTINIVSELEEWGYLSKAPRHKDGEQTSNSYTITLPGVVNQGLPPSQPQLTPVVNQGLPESSFNHQLNIIEDDFQSMQVLAETVIGLPVVTQADMAAIKEWVENKVIEPDIRGALAWRKDNRKKAVKTIAQLSPGVLTERGMRIQGANGSKPKRPNSIHTGDL